MVGSGCLVWTVVGVIGGGGVVVLVRRWEGRGAVEGGREGVESAGGWFGRWRRGWVAAWVVRAATAGTRSAAMLPVRVGAVARARGRELS
jgi:hypothetical protein